MSSRQVQEALGSRGRPGDEVVFLRALVNVSPALEPVALARATEVGLRVIQRMPEEHESEPPGRERALEVLAPLLSPEQLAHSLEFVNRTTIPLTRVFGLLALLPHLSDHLRGGAVEAVRASVGSISPDGWDYPMAICALATLSSQPEKGTHLEEGLSRLRLGYVGHEEALASLLPHLGPEWLESVLRWVYKSGRLKVLPEITRRLVTQVDGEAVRGLADYLGGEGEHSELRSLARLHLIPYLPRDQADVILDDAVASLRHREYSHRDRETYAQIIAYLDDARVGRALELARDFNRSDRITALGALRACTKRGCPSV
jgi:hypothetical protein